MPYSPADYWRDLHRRDDLSAVGQSALPAALNAWLYRTLARNVGGAVRRHGLDRPAPRRVFDVGAGTGFWIAWWRARGAAVVDGCDLVPEAVERLNARFGTDRGVVRVADVTDPAGLGAATYDLVSCQNVLLHVTEDAAFVRALANVAALVAPGGTLLLTEPALLDPAYERPYDPERHSRARPLAAYRGPLEAAGLVLVAVEAATVLGNNPIEAASRDAYRRYARWWAFVARSAKEHPWRIGLLGRAILALDPIAIRRGAAPSSKLLVLRRPDS